MLKMSKTSELYALRRSFSGDTQVKAATRSGERNESGAILWDFIAHAPSAEEDITEAEEREEQLAAKRKFAHLLRLYFKKILTESEYKFLAACIRENKSLYAVGKSQGVKYKEIIESITAKCKQNEKEFFLLMSYTGYDCRRGCEFMSQIFNGNKRRRDIRAKLEAYREQNIERVKEYYRTHLEEKRTYNKNYYRQHCEEIISNVLNYYALNRESIIEYHHNYYRENRGAILQKYAEYRETHKAERAKTNKAYRERNKEKIQARKKEYAQTPRARELAKARHARYAERNKEKILARRAAYNEKRRIRRQEARRKINEQQNSN